MTTSNKYYAVNDRPVMLARSPDGRETVYVFDFKTGNLIVDNSYFSHLTPGSGKDVDSFTPEQFEQRVTVSRVELLRTWCERMSALKTGSTDELDTIVGNPGPADALPLGAEDIQFDGDNASITLRLPRGVMTRGDLEKRMGVSVLEQAEPHRYQYRVTGSGADHVCSVFASTPFNATGADAPVIAVTLRRDRSHGTAAFNPLAQQIRNWAERLCSVRSTSKPDLAAALGGAVETTPADVTQIVLDDRDVGLGGADVRVLPGVLRRSHIAASFGAGDALPRLAPNHPIRRMHEVKVAGAPLMCSVFVEYGLDDRDDVVRGVKLRVDQARPETTN